jgi:hemerythrin-like domain-containing protein
MDQPNAATSHTSEAIPGTWADSPFLLIATTKSQSEDIPPGHSCIAVAREMAAVHNIILRALNVCCNQALQVKAGTPQAADFIVFNQCFDEALHIHHDSEEQFFFPALQKLTGIPGFMEGNVEQHKVFTAAAKAYQDYVHSVKPEEYDGQKLRDLINAFAGPLREHLVEELETLLALKDFDSEKVWKSINDTRLKALGTLDSYRSVRPVLQAS